MQVCAVGIKQIYKLTSDLGRLTHTFKRTTRGHDVLDLDADLSLPVFLLQIQLKMDGLMKPASIVSPHEIPCGSGTASYGQRFV